MSTALQKYRLAYEALHEIHTHCISKAGPLHTPTLAEAWSKFDRISVMATNAMQACIDLGDDSEAPGSGLRTIGKWDDAK